MDTAKSLGKLLVDQPVGRWVVLDAAMTHLIASGATPQEALHKAGITDSAEKQNAERPVMMQVPDPGMLCLY